MSWSFLWIDDFCLASTVTIHFGCFLSLFFNATDEYRFWGFHIPIFRSSLVISPWYPHYDPGSMDIMGTYLRDHQFLWTDFSNQVSQLLSTHVTSDRNHQLCQLTSLIHRLRDEAPAEAPGAGGRLLARVIPSFFYGIFGRFASVFIFGWRHFLSHRIYAQAIESMEISLARLRKEQVVRWWKTKTNGRWLWVRNHFWFIFFWVDNSWSYSWW